MFIHMETNKKAESIKAWLANNRRKETQKTLAEKFGKSRVFVSMALNKQTVTEASENMINEIYSYLSEKYGI